MMMQAKSAVQSVIPDNVPLDRVVDYDFYNPPGVELDFHQAWKKFQDSAPADIVWTAQNGGHWIAVRGQDIHNIYADHEHFTNKITVIPAERGKVITIVPVTLDPPEHQAFRSLLDPYFTPSAIARLEPKIRAQAISLIEGFRADGRCDFTTDYAERLPIAVFMSLVGLPIADVDKLKVLANQFTRPDGSMTTEQVMQGFMDYLKPFIVQRRKEPGDDLLSNLVTATVHGRPLTDKEAIDLSTQVLIAGLDTVVSFLSFMMLSLARSPDHRRALVENPKLVRRAVFEYLRRFPIVTNVRTVSKEHSRDGITLRPNDFVLLPTMLHGLDEKMFEDPLEVDYDRPLAANSTFGNGIHRCPGARLAQVELTVTLQEWLSRIPEFSIDPGHKVTTRGGIVGCVTSLPLRWA